MYATQLIKTFKMLTRQEREAVCDLTASTYFNKKPELVLLARYLADYTSGGQAGYPDKHQVFRVAFPGKPYNDASLRMSMTKLLKLTERFLAFSEMETNEHESTLYALRSLRKKRMEHRFMRKIKDAQIKLEETPYKDSRAHHLQYSLASEYLEGQRWQYRSSRLQLHPLHNHLTAYYLSEMLHLACSALTHQAISSQVYDMNLLQSVLELAQQFGVETYPAVAIYYHACMAMREPDNKQHYEAWKHSLIQHEVCFSKEELRSIYLLGINICIRRMNQGNTEFIREAFVLYQTALEKNLLTENGYLSAFTFKNVIRVGIALNEQVWTQDFFENYQGRLHPQERDNIVRYNAAYLYFREEAYDKAMPLLQKVEFDDVLNNLDARRMLLISYFELGELSALESLLHSFRTYLRRQKDMGYHKELYLNLLRFLGHLLSAPPGDRRFLKALEHQVIQTDHVAEKEWLLSKIRQH